MEEIRYSINEIFASVQGEGCSPERPRIFVRLRLPPALPVVRHQVFLERGWLRNREDSPFRSSRERQPSEIRGRDPG